MVDALEGIFGQSTQPGTRVLWWLHSGCRCPFSLVLFVGMTQIHVLGLVHERRAKFTREESCGITRGVSPL